MAVIENRLKELNIEIPESNPPAANYIPYKVVNNLVHISGQIAIANGEIKFKGKVGRDLDLEQGQEAAKVCAINVLSQLKQACDGDLNRVKSCVRLGVYVNSTEDFTKQPLVANGASDLMVEIFGEKGQHTRAAIGCPSLPRDTAVEVDAIFEIA